MRLALLGTGLIGRFYAQTIQSHRSRDVLHSIYSRNSARARAFADEFNIAHSTDCLRDAIDRDDIDGVIIGLPNFLHLECCLTAAELGKAVFCTKPLGLNADEALQMLQAVERSGVFHAYLEDLVYTPKTLAALRSVGEGAVGQVLWVRSRETHPGPHSDWFWNRELSGGGAIVDMGCHCIEIARSFIGKDIRPTEVMCWADTQVHPIEAEDHAIGLVKYENGAVGQFEVSWNFRGGMDLRDEVAGTQGTIWLNHWLRTGFEMFSAEGQQAYVSEKAESNSGWLFPVGDEAAALGYREMFTDAFDAWENQTQPRENFYDGYVVNSIMDAAYKSIVQKTWAPIIIDDWRGQTSARRLGSIREYDDQHRLIKEELMPNGDSKVILRHKETGQISQRSGSKA